MAATGPQPREAIDRVAGLGCDVVMGNTDEWLIEPRDESIEDDDTRRIVEIDLWAHEQLERRHHRRCCGSYRPLVELDGLLCYHGSPRSNTEVLLPITPEAELAAMLDGHDEAIMAGGHTHMPMLRRHGASLVINPGSVGMPFEHAADGTLPQPALGRVRDRRRRRGRVPPRAGGRGRGHGRGAQERHAERRLVGEGLGLGVGGC